MASETSEIDWSNDEAVVRAAVLNRRGAEPSYETTTGNIIRYWFNGTYTECEIYGNGAGSVAAWQDARKDHFVVAFESTLRVQQAAVVDANDVQHKGRSFDVGRVQDAPEVRHYTCDSCMGEFTTATKYRHPLCPLCHAGQGIDHRENGKQDAPEVVREDAEGELKANFVYQGTAEEFREGAEHLLAAKPLSPDSPERNGFICAEWRMVEEGPILNYEKPYKRRQLVNRCDLPEGHLGKHLDHVLLVSWDAEDPPNSLRTRPEGEAKVTYELIVGNPEDNPYASGHDTVEQARNFSRATKRDWKIVEIRRTVIETRTKEPSRER